MLKIAIDTGGTFTDYTCVGTLDGLKQKQYLKNATNHENPAEGIMEGLKELAELLDTNLNDLLANTSQIIHGTTLALNALLERKGAKTALFTTEGFRDALEIRRSQLDNQWDIRAVTPPVLVPRRLRIGITERVGYDGKIIKELDEESVRKACKKCKNENVESIAICYLFSFLEPEHERRTKEIIEEELPGVFVSLSSEVSPQIREYERSTTTVINAYIAPILSTYLENLKERLGKYGWNKPIHIMMNSGGLSDIEMMKKIPAKTLLSGPAGGGIGNQNLSKILDKKNLILGDMGGTSFDLHIVDENENLLVPESRIESYPITLPMMNIHSIGAGGGSIISVSEGGVLHVGPESAGSNPGPACYAKGGNKPTITDALLVLGLISEDNFLGGKYKLSKDLAINALDKEVASKLGVSVIDAASIVYRVASELMADSLRLITMKKGNNPRDYSLVSSGGAFGLFACNIMESLEMKEVLIPVQGPVFCSWGMLGALRRYDIVQSFFMEKNEWDYNRLNRKITEMKDGCCNELTRLGVNKEEQDYKLELEVRYIGQHHELSIKLDKLEFNNDDVNVIDKLFHQKHMESYQYNEPENEWEIVNIHLSANEKKFENSLLNFRGDNKKEGYTLELSGEAFNLNEKANVNVYTENDLNKTLNGPALIEFDYTSVLVPEKFSVKLIDDGMLSIKKME